MMRNNYFHWKETQTFKVKIEGVECVFFADNLANDGLVLIRYGTLQLTTKQAKSNISTVIKLVGDIVEGIAGVDERFEKYSTALSVLNVISAVLNRKSVTEPTTEAAKIAIDVIKEISLMEVKDEFQRSAIKAVALIAKLFLGAVSE